MVKLSTILWSLTVGFIELDFNFSTLPALDSTPAFFVLFASLAPSLSFLGTKVIDDLLLTIVAVVVALSP